MNEQVVFIAVLIVLMLILVHKCKCDHEGLVSGQKYLLHLSNKDLRNAAAARWTLSGEPLMPSKLRDVGPAELQERMLLGM